jgi:hypothetical protein
MYEPDVPDPTVWPLVLIPLFAAGFGLGYALLDNTRPAPPIECVGADQHESIEDLISHGYSHIDDYGEDASCWRRPPQSMVDPVPGA